MKTQVDAITSGIYRLSTLTDAVPGGFSFNSFVVAGDEPLLLHTGPRQLFPPITEALVRVMPIDSIVPSAPIATSASGATRNHSFS